MPHRLIIGVPHRCRVFLRRRNRIITIIHIDCRACNRIQFRQQYPRYNSSIHSIIFFYFKIKHNTDVISENDVVSVGSTPTMKVWEGWAGVNEIRPGNYIFNDAIQIALNVAVPGDCALTVAATVISRPAPDRAVIDAGSKTLALDKGGHGAETAKGFGLVLGRQAVLERLSEEHGMMVTVRSGLVAQPWWTQCSRDS